MASSTKNGAHLEELKMVAEMLRDEVHLFWTRYAVYLGLNGALISVWSALVRESDLKPFNGINFEKLFSWGLAAAGVLGIVLAISWIFTVKKGQALSLYWWDRAEQLHKEELTELRIFRSKRYDEFMLQVGRDGKAKFWASFSRLTSITTMSIAVPFALVLIWCALTFAIAGLSIGLILVMGSIGLTISYIVGIAYRAKLRIERHASSKESG